MESCHSSPTNNILMSVLSETSTKPSLLNVYVRYVVNGDTKRSDACLIIKSEPFSRINEQLRLFVLATPYASVKFVDNSGPVPVTKILDETKTPDDVGVSMLVSPKRYFLVTDTDCTVTVEFPVPSDGASTARQVVSNLKKRNRVVSPMLPASELYKKVAEMFGLPVELPNHTLWITQGNRPLIRDDRPIGDQGIVQGVCALRLLSATAAQDRLQEKSSLVQCNLNYRCPVTKLHKEFEFRYPLHGTVQELKRKVRDHILSSTYMVPFADKYELVLDEDEPMILTEDCDSAPIQGFVRGEICKLTYRRIKQSNPTDNQIKHPLLELTDVRDLDEVIGATEKRIANLAGTIDITKKTLDLLLDMKKLKDARQTLRDLEASIIKRAAEVGDVVADMLRE